jgi:WD40 repeat protein
VAISPDNRWVVTGSSDKSARLWDLSAKDPAANPIILRGHEGAVLAVAISPDNRWVVTRSDDNTACLWLLQINDLISLARVTAGRNFSANEWQLYFPGQPYHIRHFPIYRVQKIEAFSVPQRTQNNFPNHAEQN